MHPEATSPWLCWAGWRWREAMTWVSPDSGWLLPPKAHLLLLQPCSQSPRGWHPPLVWWSYGSDTCDGFWCPSSGDSDSFHCVPDPGTPSSYGHGEGRTPAAGWPPLRAQDMDLGEAKKVGDWFCCAIIRLKRRHSYASLSIVSELSSWELLHEKEQEMKASFALQVFCSLSVCLDVFIKVAKTIMPFSWIQQSSAVQERIS